MSKISNAIQMYQQQKNEIEEIFNETLQLIISELNVPLYEQVEEGLLVKSNAQLLDIDAKAQKQLLDNAILLLDNEKKEELAEALHTLKQTIAHLDTTRVTKAEVDILESIYAS